MTSIDYGPATPAVRRLLAEWRAISWFTPPAADGLARATSLFHAHNTAAHAYSPDTFAPTQILHSERGGWPEFTTQWQRLSAESQDPAPTSTSSWDWYFTGLKPLAYAHSRRRGFDLARHPACADVDLGGIPKLAHQWRPVDQRTREDPLFFRISEDTAVWDIPRPELAHPADLAHTGSSYASYALSIFTYALEWQLAEASADLTGNPFAPLLQVYAARVYPFVLARDQVVLFTFV